MSGSTELWLPVLGCELFYEVSDQGRVRRIARGKGVRGDNYVLKPHETPRGYRQIVICVGGRRASRLVCQLVCEAFHGPRPPGQEVRHLDGDSRNDRPSNLEWGTHQANMTDMQVHQTHANSVKTHCTNGHEFSPENTVPRKLPSGLTGRRCRACRSSYSKGSAK